MRVLAAAAGLALIAIGGGAAAGDRASRADDWRRIATDADRTRLRGWRTAWTTALPQVLATTDGAAALRSDPALYDPDAILDGALPPPGAYRCRTVKLGARGAGGLGYVAYGWFRCMVGTGPYPKLAKVDGSQRQIGTLYPDTDARAVFLGTLVLGDERIAMPYRRDPQRDVAGWMERIGQRRWRVVFPYPAYESTLDLLEMVPDS